MDLSDSLILCTDCLLEVISFFQRKNTLGIQDSRPVELGEILGFIEIRSVGKGKRVTGSSVKCLVEMDNLAAFFLLVILKEFPLLLLFI